MIEPRVKRASATSEERATRQSGATILIRPASTTDDESQDEPQPERLPSSARRYRQAVPVRREFMIHLIDGRTLYVTEQKLATLGSDYQVAAREVPAGTIAHKHRQPRPNPNRAEPTPAVIYVQPAQRDTKSPPAGDTPTGGERVGSVAGKTVLVLGICFIIMAVGYVLFNMLGRWWQTTQDDWQYGRPRTYQVDANVGHGTAHHPTSHFLAQNLNRHIIVIETPGDDPTHTKIYIGPTVMGEGQDLTPVTLSFEDVNHDGLPDLVIHVGDSTYLFLNQKDGTFKPAPNQQ